MNGRMDSIFSTVSHYRLNGLVIAFWGERDFPCQPCPDAQPAVCTMGNRSCLEVKWLVHGADKLPPCSAEVANGLQLYLHLPSVRQVSFYMISFYAILL
jgi:hypothetical protein